jgi:UDP:flavonoid glycosyltransferase YjiC (YdhE family)
LTVDRILFTTSNGTGLGHLTRSMAIARRLGPELEAFFITLSAAAPVVEQMGFPVEYVASYATPGSGNDYRWSRRLRGRLRAAIAELEPRVVVFDGTHPYEALLGALPNDSVTVWCRRPLWKAGSSTVPLGRAGAFDAVLEPGELAESEDRGPTVALREGAHRVDPIVLLDRDELLPRAQAEAELGLEPGHTNVLVTLGQGAEVRDANRRTLAALAGREGVQVAALSSALASVDEVPEGVVHLRATYPMSRYFSAFDMAVAAAGYNAYHELIALGVPTLFVPMPRDTDDQPARARYAEAAGLGLGLTGPDDPELEAQIERLLHPEERNRIQAGIVQLDPANGSADAAGWLEGLRPGEATDAGAGKRGSFRSWRRRWGTFLSSMPQTASRLTRQTLTQRPPRALVVAVGIPDDELPAALMAALAEADESPERTLVVTDSLALGRLRDLGFGIEHVPTRGSRQHVVADVPYEEFLHRRLELIRAERPRPPRLLSAPGGAPLP